MTHALQWNMICLNSEGKSEGNCFMCANTDEPEDTILSEINQ